MDIHKIKALRETENKKRYNVTLNEADVEEIQTILRAGLSPSLQFLIVDFLEEWKDNLEAEGEWKEDPITPKERKILDEYYKEFPERFADLKTIPEMKKRRIEKGRFFLIKKEKRYKNKLKKEEELNK